MIQVCKIPSPQAILIGFCIVTVKVLNSYILNIFEYIMFCIRWEEFQPDFQNLLGEDRLPCKMIPNGKFADKKCNLFG